MSQAYARTRQVIPVDKTLDASNGRVYEVPRGAEDWDAEDTMVSVAPVSLRDRWTDGPLF